MKPPLSDSRARTAALPGARTRPLIALTSYVRYADWTDWAAEAVIVPYSYIDRLRAVGGTPIVAPPGEPQAVSELLSVIDGLMLIGGEDVCASLYGGDETAQEHSRHQPIRDSFEIELVRQAWAADLPVLGICRGMQVMNVAMGGSLICDLDNIEGSEHLLEHGNFHLHRVRTTAGSLVASRYGADARVPSHHHQAIDRRAPGFTPTAVADDKIVEAFEAPGRRFFVGVQWHPEEAEQLGLFEALVEAASITREARLQPGGPSGS